MTNSIVASILLILALLLWVANRRGFIKNSILDELDKIASIVAFLSALAFFALQPLQSVQKFDYRVRVVERGSGQSIPDAEVTIDILGEPDLDGITDVNGVASIPIPVEYVEKRGRIIVDATNYRRHIEETSISQEEQPSNIQLELINTIIDEKPQTAVSRDSSAPHPNSNVNVSLDQSPNPLDVMVVIDNSCSMFKKEAEACLGKASQYGNDPDFLRIRGTSSFIARLGFAEPNESEYRLGTISLGEEPILTSPLMALSTNRDALIESISNPAPKLETRIVPALELAYQELRRATPKPLNQKVVVLITDGFPYPPENQSNSDLTNLVSANKDITTFIMLLEPSNGATDEFKQYIDFWKKVGLNYPHVFTYLIDSDNKITQTYSEITGQLQNTVSSLDSIEINRDIPTPIYISKFVKKVTITIIHKSASSASSTVVRDPTGIDVSERDDGVQWLYSRNKQLEIISITSPRLQNILKEKPWTIVSNTSAELLLDRRSSYSINIESPEVTLTETKGVYLATRKQNSNDNFVLKWNLRDDSGEIISEVQPIQGEIIDPNGISHILPIPTNITPDQYGSYSFSTNFIRDGVNLPYSMNRLTFIINSGFIDSSSDKRVPIATTRIYVDVEVVDRDANKYLNEFLFWVASMSLCIVSVSIFIWSKFLKKKDRVNRDKNICPNCKHHNRREAKFCSQCGGKL